MTDFAGAGPEGAAADLHLIKTRLSETLLSRGRPGDGTAPAQDPLELLVDDPALVERLLGSLLPDGSWEDLRYGHATVKDLAHGTLADWGSTSSHLVRLLNLARAFRAPSGRWHADEALRGKILLAFDFWLRNDFRHAGWWQDQIGIQERLGGTLLLMDEWLSSAQREAAVRIMERSRLKGFTGANLLWMAGNQIVRGCIAGQAAPVAEAYEGIAGEIRVAPGPEEGIKADWSFFQHGEQLYSGGYGLQFSVYCARFASAAEGTRFALPPEKARILTDFVLEGQRWMVWGPTFDYNAVGREICRKDKDGRLLRHACHWLPRLAPERSSELAALAENLAGRSLRGPIGNRHYWRSDLMVHRRAGYYASVRMLSPRAESSECVRGEGLRLHHLADGVTFLYRDAREYANIFPVWDWRRLPGITCVHLDEPLLPEEMLRPPENPTREEADRYAIRLDKAVASRGVRDFVGGVSDGTCGLAAMDFVRGPLSARKAWFFLDREIVCLGAGITSSAEAPVLTSVNQCLLRGPVTLSDGTTLAHGRRELRGRCGVHHDGVGYLFPGEGDLVVAAEEQRGDWHDISLPHRSEPAAADVFSLWMDHGAPVSGGSYCYLVVPAIEAGALGAYAASTGVRVLRNTPALQAIRHAGSGRVLAAFYEAGGIRAGDLELSVDRPCLLIIRETAGALEIVVSNPENRPLVVGVTANRRVEGKGCRWIGDRGVSQVTIELPDGEAAGSSVVRRLALVQ